MVTGNKMAKEPYAFEVRWQEAKRTRESKMKKVGGRGMPPESIVLIWKYIQKHIQILLACLPPIYICNGNIQSKARNRVSTKKE